MTDIIDRNRDGTVRVHKADQDGFVVGADGQPVKKKFISSRAEKERETIPPRSQRWQPVFNDPDEGQDEGTKKRGRDLRTIAQYAEDGELGALADEIRKRRAKMPSSRYWICDNEKCRQVFHRPGPEDMGGDACIHCNYHRYADGGRLREMTPAEVSKYKAGMKAAFQQAADRDREFRKIAVVAAKVFQDMREK